MRSICHRNALLRVLVVAVVAAAGLTPAVSSAQEPDPAQQQAQVRAQQAQVALDVDALTAEDAQVQAALVEIQANVDAHQATLAGADRAKADADAALAAADQALTSTQQQFDALDAATDDLVVEAFMNPPTDQGLDAFRAGTMTEAAVKRSLVEIQTESDQDLLDQLDQAKVQLANDQAAKAAAATEAETTRAAAATALADVQAAQAQQQAFAADLETRLEAKLAEAEALRQTDAALSDRIAAQQAQLAANLAALGGPSGNGSPTQIAPAPGGLATVACPAGGSITVAGDIAANVAALLGAAAADGIQLCGGGYRDPQDQIDLRIAHCGPTYYDIYEKPASQCDPPTARPGTSLHEQGLAIDFTCNGGGTVARGTACWDWLVANANDYGLYNLPTESWHWSVNGN